MQVIMLLYSQSLGFRLLLSPKSFPLYHLTGTPATHLVKDCTLYTFPDERDKQRNKQLLSGAEKFTRMGECYVTEYYNELYVAYKKQRKEGERARKKL